MRRWLRRLRAGRDVVLTTVTTGGVITVAQMPRREAAQRAVQPDVLSFRIDVRT
jgi:hypothetical protein